MSVYCELLACYLASQPPDLAQAKFLMQRVPPSVQESPEGAELVRLWRIGKNMWTRNTAEVYTSLAGPWSESVQRILDKVGCEHKAYILILVMFSSISAHKFHEDGKFEACG